MAGLIRKEDIDEVRARTDIREIIEGYVSLKSARFVPLLWLR